MFASIWVFLWYDTTRASQNIIIAVLPTTQRIFAWQCTDRQRCRMARSRGEKASAKWYQICTQCGWLQKSYNLTLRSAPTNFPPPSQCPCPTTNHSRTVHHVKPNKWSLQASNLQQGSLSVSSPLLSLPERVSERDGRLKKACETSLASDVIYPVGPSLQT